MTAEEFYAQRDNRTNMMVENNDYQLVAVTLSINSSWAQTYPGQTAFLVAANILSRWCRQVTLECPVTKLDPRLTINEPMLHDRAMREMRDADPFGRFEHGQAVPGSLRLHLGPDGPEGQDVWNAHGHGWRATISRSASHDQTSDVGNPIGAMGAACLGVAALFIQATRQAVFWAEPSVINFFDFGGNAQTSMPGFPDQIDLGNALMVGAGAVGGAILYLLRMLPVAGRLDVVEHDVVKILNLNRSPLIGMKHVGQPKVKAAEQHFLGHALSVVTHAMTFDQYMEKTRNLNADLIIPVANEHNVRWDLANNNPPLLVYGTTGSDWSAHLGRHIPFVEECLACRFHNESLAPAMTCSSGAIQAEQSVLPDAALPFLSVLAGLLAVAELCKLQQQGYPFHGGRVAINVGGNPSAVFPVSPAPRADCGACNRKSAPVFNILRGQTRWATLSPLHSDFG